MIDDSYQRVGLAIIVAFTVLGGVAVLLRLWSRWLSRSPITSDDYMIVLSCIISTCQGVTMWYLFKTSYIGIHARDIPKDYDAKLGRTWEFANQLLYNPALTTVKLAIILFLRRLNSHSRVVNYLIWSSFVVVIGLFIAVLLVDIFQCNPVSYVYDKSIQGSCINQSAFFIATAAVNLISDLMVLSIPIIITARLQMPLRRKIAVCVILCLGGIATGVGVWRIILIVQSYMHLATDPDPTYSIAICSSAVEVNVAIVTACAPSMKAIASRYLPKLLGSSRNGGKTSYGTGPSNSTGFWSRKLGKSTYTKRNSNMQSGCGEEGYEMADPLGGSRFEVTADKFDMRKYRRGGDSGSDITLSDDGKAGIMKRTEISVGYSETATPGDGRSASQGDGRSQGKAASVDSIV
ncbi:hypothetical protein N7457_005588 [Penicillium paradoxum]|uniref:uncharacterized protein n=1 Tax=Penicillium paradoxum TaxID=176176 RepID=UPI0025473FB1|nr:uncharacterized protein N7457_005588 [Penicillium paradoxum]KAJ5780428.1 hypothetical protein N7457_005588 [Penicillium paradoxum]